MNARTLAMENRVPGEEIILLTGALASAIGKAQEMKLI